jgi:hypothetical protein
MPSRPHPELRLLVALAIAAVVVFAIVSSGVPERSARQGPASWRGLVGDAHPVVATEQRQIVLLRSPSVADRLQRARYATEEDERRWAAQAYAVQEQVLTVLAAHGLGIRPDYNFVRVVNGFSAVLDGRALTVLESTPEVAGIYPVRAAFPASLSTEAIARAAAVGPTLGLPGYDGHGQTIALLDTGVDLDQPYVEGRVDAGIDVVGATETAAAQPNPQERTELERHGTHLAGLLVGDGGPGGMQGVAPGATVLPIRVAGWQPDAEGRMVVYSRSDQLIAGLERAVDPDGDGDTHDAARIALVGVAAPFAAFPASPEARAVSGALALDTLVVAPAGNDGAAGPLYGSLAGPGGAPDAITVAAADERPTTASVHVVLRAGLDVLLDDDVPLLGTVAPARSGELAIGVPRAGGRRQADYFNRRGFSLVAGRAAVVRPGIDPGAAAIAAAEAGAAAVLFHGEGIPAGSLGLSSEVDVPVVALPARPARQLLEARRNGFGVAVAFGRVHDASNLREGRVASFSSRGLAFGGFVKPDLAAPGVALATSDVVSSNGEEPAYATVNGTSAAAAVAAGSAAVLAQARPGLGARELASLLVGYARPATGVAIDATGVGALDLGASAVAEIAATSRSIAFGAWRGPGWRATRTFTIRNVSSRRLVVALDAVAHDRSESVELDVTPRRLVLRVGREARVAVTARATAAPDDRVATGVVAIRPVGSETLRVPWAIVFPGQSSLSLLPAASLEKTRFAPSDTDPVLLHVRAGTVIDSGGNQILPASRLDVLLYSADGRFIGVLARLRDLLPGAYTFGITGRGANGVRLKPGRYELRLVAWSLDGGEPSRTRVRFAIT